MAGGSRATLPGHAASLAARLCEPWFSADLPARPEHSESTARIEHDTTVLVGRTADEELDAIERELLRRGQPVARVDPALRSASGRHSFDPTAPVVACHALVCRSIDHFAPVAHHAERTLRTEPALAALPSAEHAFHVDQMRAALLGRLAALSPRISVNDPWAQQRAELKTVQARVAAEQGLIVPDTLVTDDAERAASFVAAHGGHAVIKALASPVVHCTDSTAGFLYTTAVRTSDFDGSLPFRTPTIVQERLVPLAEYRVTVVGDWVFTARTDITSGREIDWRRQLNRGVPFALAPLPADVQAAVVRTVRALGLQYAAVDLLEEDDRMLFLELNPAGAYRWLETGLRMSITEAVCDLLGTL